MNYVSVLETQVVVSFAFALVWVFSLIGRKASYADVAWSLGFILAAALSIPAEPGPTPTPSPTARVRRSAYRVSRL